MMTDALKHLMAHDPEAWLRQSVAYYHAFGLLSLSAEEARAALLRGWDTLIPPEAAANPHRADMFLLAECRAPVWWGDLECVYPGADAYTTLLREWAAIGRGAFAPAALAEHWAADQRTAEVVFSLNGVEQRFTHAASQGDFVDMALVTLINGLIRGTGIQYEICDMGMPNFVIALNAAEKARLRHERGWAFEDRLSGSAG